MNRGRRQKGAAVWLDFAKYVLVAGVVSGILVKPVDWRVVIVGFLLGAIAYVVGLMVEPPDKKEEV